MTDDGFEKWWKNKYGYKFSPVDIQAQEYHYEIRDAWQAAQKEAYERAAKIAGDILEKEEGHNYGVPEKIRKLF